MSIQTTAFGAHEYDDPTKSLVLDEDRLGRLERFLTGRPLVVDYETDGLHWHKGARFIGVGLGTWDDSGKFWAAYIPVRHRTGEPQLGIDEVGPVVQRLLENPDTLKIAYNIKFEDHFTRSEGWVLAGPRYDPMIAARLYDENQHMTLENRADVDLGYGPDAWGAKKMVTKIVAGLAKQNRMKITAYKDRFGYSEIPVAPTAYYCGHDLQYAAELYQHYEAWGVSRHYAALWPMEMRLTEVLCDMERNGLPVDIPYLEGVREKVRRTKAELVDSIGLDLKGDKFNWASDAELRRFMIDVLELHWDDLTPAGRKAAMDGPGADPYKHWSVTADILRKFSERHPILGRILEIREADKIETTYTTSLLDKLDAQGSLHGNMQQVGTNTGRLSCRDPNYQNMPAGPLIRTAFITRPQWRRVFLDYSQVELRVLAHYSQDRLMLRTYMDGGDIHETTRREVSDMVGREVPRRLAKVINFGLSYGLTEKGLAHQADIPQDDARQLLTSFFQKFTGVQSFCEELWATARRQGGQWDSMFGRTRRLPDLLSPIRWKRLRAERQMIGSAIQGTAAHLTRQSLVRIADWIDAENLGAWVKLANTVHDEIQIDTHPDCLALVVRQATALMEDFPEFHPVPMLVDVEVTATNWADKVPYTEWNQKMEQPPC